MKTKNIITVTLVTLLLASCAPLAKVVPTETTIPLMTKILVLPTQIVTAEPNTTLLPMRNTAVSTESIALVSLCGESVLVSPTQRNLTVKNLHVTLQYPPDWECDETGNLGSNYYSGTDGFFQILNTAVPNAKEFCEAQARQSVGKGRNLFGLNPTIELLQVDNQRACLILPSNDQPQYQRGLSMLVVEYPNPDGKYGPLLILDADKNHIHDFIGTLKFIR